MSTRTQIENLAAHLEDLWADFDVLFDELDPAGWQIGHGPDWVLADVPFHLAYFDRYTARCIEQGRDLPPQDRLELATLNDMNRWNAENFAGRSADQTPPDSLAEMRAARDELRRILSTLRDADLARPAWMHLTFLRGWRNVETLLIGCIMHTWNEFIQFRIHMGRDTPLTRTETLNLTVPGFLQFYAAMTDPQAIADQRMQVVFRFSDPGVDSWTLQIDEGRARLVPGTAPDPDIVFTQSTTTLMKTFNNMHDPVVAMQTGEIQVEGSEHLPVYSRLFITITPETPFGAIPGG